MIESVNKIITFRKFRAEKAFLPGMQLRSYNEQERTPRLFHTSYASNTGERSADGK
jgi:hypothetical protein